MNGVPYAIYGDRERFAETDKGGAVYVLPADSFSVTQPDDHPDEWTSRESVKPIETIPFASGLDAMLDNGVQVFFTDPETLEQLRTADPVERMELLNGLRSENEVQGRNPEKFPMDIEEPPARK